MCNNSLPPTDEQRKHNLAELHEMTNETYWMMRNIARQYCHLDVQLDEDDMTQDLLILALEKFDGRGPLGAFLHGCARHMRLKKNDLTRRRPVNFTTIAAQSQSKYETSEPTECVDSFLFHKGKYGSLKYDESGDLHDEVRRALLKHHDSPARDKALIILDAFLRAVQDDTGLGVDEYDLAPQHAADLVTGKVYNCHGKTRTVKLARNRMAKRISEDLGTSERNAYRYMRSINETAKNVLAWNNAE